VLELERTRPAGLAAPSAPAPPPPTGGAEGNSRLTGTTAAALIVLLAAEGVTILAIRPLLSAHVMIGMALVPIVLLKLGSTLWRFVCYYRGDPAYRAAGAPKPLLRLLGPVVVVATVSLFASGIALVAMHPHRGAVLGLHKASFVVWFGAMSAHVLGHVLKLPRLASADWTRRDGLPGARTRRWLLAGALVLGLVLAVASIHLAAPWQQLHSFGDH
jgi:hypothetical protein